MIFKKLEVYGFKSFADKLTVEFAPGITAIVGPNGCGKSNVADSIRWALGEQSAKSLRGSQMLDVIFNGTESRRSMSYCEVSLYFDNTNRVFDSEYNELVISRKLYRNLESVYYINKKESRLRDIIAMLHGSGLGKDSYSIIGQGRIDEILSAKAEDRRAIFEDAAGISKSKQAKTENERHLARINEKMLRVLDITMEQEKQLKPLAQQAENAKQAFELKDRLRTLEVNSYLYQHDTMADRKSAIEQAIRGLDEEFSNRQKEYDNASDAYAASMEEANNIDVKIRELNNERLNITINLERQAGEIKLAQSKISGLKEQNKLLQDEIERAQKQMEECTQNISVLSETKLDQQNQLAAQRRLMDDLSTKYLNVTELLMKNEGEVEQAHKELVASMDKLGDIKANISALRAEKAALEDRTADYQKRADAAKEEIAERKGRIDVANIELRDLKQKLSEATENAERFSTQNNECTFLIRDLAAKVDKATQKLLNLQARQKMLSEMVNNMQGYAYSVKKLITDAKTDPKLDRAIEGHVASLIKVRSGMEVAIETALGNAIQNIVVRTEEDAKFLIEYLKDKKYGRATFLPISAVRGRTLERDQRSFLSYRGVCGIASELIEFNPKYQDIFDSLLGKTVIVDTLETAIGMARSAGFSFKIVTLDGDIINPHGAMTGGSRKAETGNILTGERELSAVTEACGEAQKELDVLIASRSETADKQEAAIKAVREWTDKKHVLELSIASKTQDCAADENDVGELRASCFELEQECRKFFDRIEEIDAQLSKVDELENAISSKRSNVDSSSAQNQKQYDVLRLNRDELHDQLTEAKVKEAAMTSKLDATEKDIQRAKSDMIAFGSTIEVNKEKLDRNQAFIEQSNVENVVIDSGSEQELREKLTIVEKKLDGLDEYKKKLQTEMQECDRIRQESSSQMSIINQNKAKKEAEIEKIESNFAFYTERISQEYELNYESCLKYKTDDFDPTHANSEVNKIKNSLLRMGNINMHAVEDYAELKARYDEEMLHKADLDASIADVRKVIEEMTAQMLTQFTTQFEKIRVNFIQCFKSLFGGGNADLILEEGDPLEAGIGILAEPPGKKLQSISLLSGGERALTAIAILFAILMLKPMPFCILDEIEAALDDANVERFAKYLHNFSRSTQFIVITHRKPTMELADSLYGVTMEEKGVSKIVSVKLSEAVKVVDQEQA